MGHTPGSLRGEASVFSPQSRTLRRSVTSPYSVLGGSQRRHELHTGEGLREVRVGFVFPGLSTGGAHRDYEAMMQIMRGELQESLAKVKGKSIDTILEKRFERLLSYGKFRASD